MTSKSRDRREAQGSWSEGIKLTGMAFIQAGKDFIRDNGPQWAAAVAYYSLLSFFPLLLAAVSIAAYFVDANWATEQLVRLLGEFLPQGEQRISETMKGVFDARGPASILSFVLLLWSGSRVFGVLVKALNQAFDVEDPYSFLKRIIAELIMVLTIGLLFIVAMASRVVIRYFGSQMNLFPGQQDVLYRLLQDLVPSVLLFVVFFLIYRFVPKVDIDTRAALAGAVSALALFHIARPLFLGYISTIASYNLIYGSLAIVVILMIWAWMISAIILFGGEITSEIQKKVLERPSDG